MTQLSALIALKITITSLFNYLKFKITLQSNKIRLTLYFINPIPIIIVTITIITQIKSIINIKIIIILPSLIIIASTIIQTLITVQVCMIRKL